MKRLKYTIANWKMNGLNGALSLVKSIDKHIKNKSYRVPSCYLSTIYINIKIYKGKN